MALVHTTTIYKHCKPDVYKHCVSEHSIKAQRVKMHEDVVNRDATQGKCIYVKRKNPFQIPHCKMCIKLLREPAKLCLNYALKDAVKRTDDALWQCEWVLND